MAYSSWLKHIWVFCRIFSPPGNMDGCLPCNRSAYHSAQWQVLELILFAGFLQHSNRRQSCICLSETNRSVHVCVSETHGSCLFPCTKRRKQSSADFCWHWKVFWYAYAARFGIIQTRKMLCAPNIYPKVISVFFVHGNGDMRACLRRWWNPFYFDERRL